MGEASVCLTMDGRGRLNWHKIGLLSIFFGNLGPPKLINDVKASLAFRFALTNAYKVSRLAFCILPAA